MTWSLIFRLGLWLGQQPTAGGMHQLTADIPGVGRVLYAISIPKGYDASRPAPLVLALHSGGERMRYYGAAYTRLLVEPALRDLQPIILAPDCPWSSWGDPAAEKMVTTLMDETMRGYAIDRTRVLVTGFSMGGRGTWFMASRHADIFTAAIPMAASTGDLAADTLARQPTYVIHSRDDEVVPFSPAQKNAGDLERQGRTIKFEAVDGLKHFEMGRYSEALRRAGNWVGERWRQK
jgi:predicted peptidase